MKELGQILTEIGRYLSFGNGKAPELSNDGVFPVYGSNGVIGYSKAANQERSIILGRVGAYCGSVYFEHGKYWATDNTIVVKVTKGNEARFFYNLLKAYPLRSLAGGSAQPLINQKTLKGIDAWVPSLPTQRKIAAILTAYDDLIEVNKRRIALLEKMAEEIYREWFVRMRFPGYQDTRFVKGVPEWWEQGLLSSFCKNFDSQRIPLSQQERDMIPGDIPYYGAAKIMGYVGKHIFEGRYLLLAEDGSVITKEGFPILQLTRGKCWVNNHAHVLQGLKDTTTEWLYLSLKRYPIAGHITGAAQPKVTQANLNRISFFRPSADILEKFNLIIFPLFDSMERLLESNDVLTKTRDLLLPRLISGKLSVEHLDIQFPPQFMSGEQGE